MIRDVIEALERLFSVPGIPHFAAGIAHASNRLRGLVWPGR